MRITTRGRYALRASLALAKLGQGGDAISIATLSEAEDISSVFLEQIFFKLKKAGIVNSVRGPGGGFNFAQPLDKLTVKALLDAAGEDMTASVCDKSSGECDRTGTCISHQVWQEANELVNDYFEKLTLKALLERKPANSGKKDKTKKKVKASRNSSSDSARL